MEDDMKNLVWLIAVLITAGVSGIEYQCYNIHLNNGTLIEGVLLYRDEGSGTPSIVYWYKDGDKRTIPTSDIASIDMGDCCLDPEKEAPNLLTVGEFIEHLNSDKAAKAGVTKVEHFPASPHEINIYFDAEIWSALSMIKRRNFLNIHTFVWQKICANQNYPHKSEAVIYIKDDKSKNDIGKFLRDKKSWEIYK
jgi:hypothetical protein